MRTPRAVAGVSLTRGAHRSKAVVASLQEKWSEQRREEYVCRRASCVAPALTLSHSCGVQVRGTEVGLGGGPGVGGRAQVQRPAEGGPPAVRLMLQATLGSACADASLSLLWRTGKRRGTRH